MYGGKWKSNCVILLHSCAAFFGGRGQTGDNKIHGNQFQSESISAVALVRINRKKMIVHGTCLSTIVAFSLSFNGFFENN